MQKRTPPKGDSTRECYSKVSAAIKRQFARMLYKSEHCHKTTTVCKSAIQRRAVRGQRSRPSMDPRMACLPFLDIHGWPGPSMDPAIPCLHKGHILGLIKLVAVFFGHICAHGAMGKLYIITAVSSLNASIFSSLIASTFKTLYETFDFRFPPYSTFGLRT